MAYHTVVTSRSPGEVLIHAAAVRYASPLFPKVWAAFVPRDRARSLNTFRTAEDYGHYFPWWVSNHHSSGTGVWRADAPAPFEGGGGSFGGAGATAHFADVDLASLGPAPDRLRRCCS